VSDTPPLAGHSRELLVATRNAGKAAELRALLAPAFARVLDLRDAGFPVDPAENEIEDGATFEANALAKARYFRARSEGRTVLADDSGLCVTALDGAPGVRSRRYAGAVGGEGVVSGANSRQLLRALEGVHDRSAEFVCAIAYVDGVDEVVTLGRTPGRILDAAHGANGFGYDPVFWSDDLQQSFGAASDAAKADVSHRARAVAALVAHLRSDPARRPTSPVPVDDVGRGSYTAPTSGA